MTKKGSEPDQKDIDTTYDPDEPILVYKKAAKFYIWACIGNSQPFLMEVAS